MAGAPQAPLALSMGEPSGIGPDLILRLYAERQVHNLPPFAVYGHLDFLRARAARLGRDLLLVPAKPEQANELFDDALPVVETGGEVFDTPGLASSAAAEVVISAIREAVADCLAGVMRGLVTSPINKAALYGRGFAFPGHTEYLAALSVRDGMAPRPVMMLAHEDLRVVPATIHVPLSDVPQLLTVDLVTDVIRITARDLKARFGVAEPKIAVTGLNPHAGEDGTIGREEAEIIRPALAGLSAAGLSVAGPFPADTAFYPPHWRQFDAVVAMYHDQALIPIKTLAFEEAVNVTLGLPIVRTSPDHGTAFGLAGTGRGSTASFLAAIRLADQMTRSRG